jgi:predicted alpha/beta hydrolase family esterase
MKKHVLFIHGGGEEGYKADQALAACLHGALGDSYEVRYPKMPNADNPTCKTWRDQIEQELAATDSEVILVGHSLGGSMLLKYLSEEQIDRPVAGLFLLAPPYWGAAGWHYDEYALQEDFAARLPGIPRVVVYHSRDDDIVPFAHLALYAAKLPQAIIRELDGRGHQFRNDLSEVVEDMIKGNA